MYFFRAIFVLISISQDFSKLTYTALGGALNSTHLLIPVPEIWYWVEKAFRAVDTLFSRCFLKLLLPAIRPNMICCLDYQFSLRIDSLCNLVTYSISVSNLQQTTERRKVWWQRPETFLDESLWKSWKERYHDIQWSRWWARVRTLWLTEWSLRLRKCRCTCCCVDVKLNKYVVCCVDHLKLPCQSTACHPDMLAR